MPRSPTHKQSLRIELKKLFAKAKMPTNPSLAARILTLGNDPNSSAGDFADVIRTDPALLTRLLKTVNSAHFAQRNPVTTVARAVTLLGLNRLKSVALGFQLVKHLDKLGGAPFDMRVFWQRSLLRACIGRSIAGKVLPSRAEEAFLIGLLQDSGILLCVQILGCAYADLYRSELSPAAFYAVEEKTFEYTHVDAISVMASEWRLPKLIAVPLERHHKALSCPESPSELEQLVAISYFAGNVRFADNLTVTSEEREIGQHLAAALELDPACLQPALNSALEEYQQIAILYEDMLPADVDVAELLSEANRQLTNVAKDADERLLNIESEHQKVEREQRRLERALSEYRERASLDPLTNLLNRGAFADAARKAVEHNRGTSATLGVLFLDLDNFKSLNDTYGHNTGDQVLKVVAATLCRHVGHLGSVCRYGGEEFVVLLPRTSPKATQELAELIVARVRALDPKHLGFAGHVTCSLGAVWCLDPPDHGLEEVIDAADKLMCQAKRTGKDRWCSAPYKESPVGGQTPGRETARPTPAPSSSPHPAGAEQAEVQLQELIETANILNNEKVDSFAGIRKQERTNIVSPCVMHYFTETGTQTRQLVSVTRNISTGGIGILVTRPTVRGEAVEVILGQAPKKTHLAGLVTFCRRINDRIYEVGMQFTTHSVDPIISGDGAEALQKYDWVAQAVLAKRTGRLTPA